MSATDAQREAYRVRVAAMATQTNAERQQYRALVADVAARAKAILPQAVNGRVEKAVALVLAGDVEPSLMARSSSSVPPILPAATCS